jgi:hypothetical protein
MRKSLLDRLAEAHNSRPEGKLLRITLRVKPSSRYGGTFYLVGVGSDHVEVSNEAKGANPTLVDRSVIIEAFTH